jgi:hypothetical protein
MHFIPEDIDAGNESTMSSISLDFFQQFGSIQNSSETLDGSIIEWNTEGEKFDGVNGSVDQDSIMKFLAFEDFEDSAISQETPFLQGQSEKAIMLGSQSSTWPYCSDTIQSSANPCFVIPQIDVENSPAVSSRNVGKRVSPAKPSAERLVRPRVAASREINALVNNSIFPDGIAGLAARNHAISEIIFAIRNGSLPSRIQTTSPTSNAALHNLSCEGINVSPSPRRQSFSRDRQMNIKSDCGEVDRMVSYVDEQSATSPETTSTGSSAPDLSCACGVSLAESESCSNTSSVSAASLAADACAAADERRERRRRQNREAQRRRRQRRANPALPSCAAASWAAGWWVPSQQAHAAAPSRAFGYGYGPACEPW